MNDKILRKPKTLLFGHFGPFLLILGQTRIFLEFLLATFFCIKIFISEQISRKTNELVPIETDYRCMDKHQFIWLPLLEVQKKIFALHAVCKVNLYIIRAFTEVHSMQTLMIRSFKKHSNHIFFNQFGPTHSKFCTPVLFQHISICQLLAFLLSWHHAKNERTRKGITRKANSRLSNLTTDWGNSSFSLNKQ